MAVKDILQKVKVSDDNVQKNVDRYVRYYKLYRNYIDDNKWSTKSKIFTPMVYTVIETQTARNIAGLPAGEWQGGDEGKAEKINEAFKKWWKEERMVLTTQDVFKKNLLYGSATAQVYWKHETGVKEGKSYVKYSGPAVRILRLEDRMFGFDPEATNFKDVKWAFVRYYLTKKELEDLASSPSAEMYKDLDTAIKDFEDGEYKNDAMVNERLTTIDSSFTKDTTIKKVEVIYMEDYQTGERITLVGRKNIILDQKNPFLAEKTLLMTSNVRIPGEVLGMSEVEPIERLQHGINLFRNQRADVIDSYLNPKTIVGDEADVEDEEILDPDIQVIHASDINQVAPQKQSANASMAFKEDEAIKNDIYAATSVTPFSMGNDNDVQADRSGKAIAHLQSAADARIKAKLTNFEVDFIKNVAEIWQRLMAQFATDTIKTEKGDVTPEDFKGEWEYWVESGSTKHVSEVANREDFLAYQEKIIELAGLKQQGGGLNFDKMAEKLSEAFGVKDWKEIWEEGEQEQPGVEQSEPEQEQLPPIEEAQPAPQVPPEEVNKVEAPQEQPSSPEKKPSLFNRLKNFLKR